MTLNHVLVQLVW